MSFPSDRTIYIPVENICFGKNPPAGMNFLKLGAMAYHLRSTAEDLDPIEVTRTPDHGVYRVHDGRHRVIASIIAGRPTVLAKEVKHDS